MQKKVEALMELVKSGNIKFNEAVDRMNGIEEAEKLRPTRRTTTTPGYASKYHDNEPNPKKKATKPFTGNGQARNTTMHGRRHAVPAPTNDQIKALESRIGHKIIVRNAKCYLRNQLAVEVPLEADTAWMWEHTFVGCNAA